jgi:hypothetical protein
LHSLWTCLLLPTGPSAAVPQCPLRAHNPLPTPHTPDCLHSTVRTAAPWLRTADTASYPLRARCPSFLPRTANALSGLPMPCPGLTGSVPGLPASVPDCPCLTPDCTRALGTALLRPTGPGPHSKSETTASNPWLPLCASRDARPNGAGLAPLARTEGP